jgi:hypothetical protein
MSDELNVDRFKRTLNIAIDANIMFEGDAQDAKEILDYFDALRAEKAEAEARDKYPSLTVEIINRAVRAEQMVERLIEVGKKLSIIALLNTREDIETWERWHALVAEWQKEKYV